jgi:hypothetical protein
MNDYLPKSYSAVLKATALALALAPAHAYCWSTPVAVDLNTTTAKRFETVLSVAAGTGLVRGIAWASNGETTDTQNGLFYSPSTNGGATWLPAQDLLNTPARPLGSWGERPCLASDLANIWVLAYDACTVAGKTITGDRDIFFLRSTNAGGTWTTPTTLNTDAADTRIQNYNPSLATNRSGVWVASWETETHLTTSTRATYGINVARSSDNAGTWSAPQGLDVPSSNSALMENPAVATTGLGTWIVAWDSTMTTDTDIRYARSTDNGLTWSPPQYLNTTALTDSKDICDGNIRLAATPAGTWVAVWTSSYDQATTSPVRDRILFARSTDNGQTWSNPAPVDATVDSTRPVRISPDVTWDGSTFAVLWTGPAGLQVSYSADGSTWSAPANVANGSGYDGSGVSRPRLASNASGLRAGAWISKLGAATGPNIIFAPDQASSKVTEWQMFW